MHMIQIKANIHNVTYNTIHYIHKSNVKLHELEVYSEHVASSYILIYKSLSAFSFSLVSYLAIQLYMFCIA